MKFETEPVVARLSGLCLAVVAGVVFGYAVSLAFLFLQHSWVLASNGLPIPSDFLTYWSAGKAALAGNAAAAYDPNTFHVLQTSLAGAFPNYFYWGYPPVFFFVVLLLGSLPYGVAYISWIAAGAGAYALAVAAIVHRRTAVLFALASPAAFLTIYTGQNGFLTAALFGGFLAALPTRPIVSGILLGLMTYKPQFGLLLPIALIASGQWRCIGSAFLTALILAIMSTAVFGADTNAQFLHALPTMSNEYLKLGGEGWPKVQSVYGAARFLGAADRTAWVVQGLVIVVSAASVALLWGGKAAFPLKAAGLVTGAMISMPYLHGYDFPVLMIALAFLYREKPFDRVDWTTAAVVNLIIAGFLLQLAPLGPIAIVLVGALATRRFVARSTPVVENAVLAAPATG